MSKAEIETLFRGELEDELRAHVQHAFEDGPWTSSALEIVADDAERYRLLSLPDRHAEDLLEYAREIRDLSTTSTVAKHLVQAAWKPKVYSAKIMDFSGSACRLRGGTSSSRSDWIS